MSKTTARELLAHPHDPHGRLLNCDELGSRVERVLALIEKRSPLTHVSLYDAALRDVLRLLNRDNE